MKILIPLMLYSLSNINSSMAQTSLWRLEPLIFLSYDFCHFNPKTNATTDETFQAYSALGAVYTKHGKQQPIGTQEITGTIDFGLLVSYQASKKICFQSGILTSNVGAANFPGVYLYTYGSGESGMVYRVPLMINVKLLGTKNNILSFNGFIGPSIDIARNDVPHDEDFESTIGVNVFRYKRISRVTNWEGFSIIGGLQLKYKLENSNSLNLNIMGAYGLVPLVTNYYTYSLNNDFYYTELISNGSFLRIGIGYEFQVLKKRFPYYSKYNLK